MRSGSGTGGRLTAVLNTVVKLRFTEVSSKQIFEEDTRVR